MDLTRLSPPLQVSGTKLDLETFQSLSPGETVLVAGGGITGMSTALSLAQQGLKVAIFEARLDPQSDQGKKVYSQAERFLSRSHQARKAGDTEEADRLLKLADSTRRQLWGSRSRGIVLDSQSQCFLKSVGVESEKLASVRHIADPVPGGLDWKAQIGQRTVLRSDGRIDPHGLVAHRDLSVQTRINEVEQLIREAVDRNPNIHMEFGAEVSGAHQDTDSASISLGQAGSKFDAGLLVVADGGGRRSLVGKLGVERLERGRERLSTVAFRDKGEPAFNQTTTLLASDTDTHLECMFAGGEGKLNVNVFSPIGQPAPTAAEVAKEWGIDEPLAQEPQVYDYIFDRAEEFVVGSRILVAGDAAARGTAIFGLGSQFGMHYAQLIGDMVAQNGSRCEAFSPESLTKYRESATRAAELRLGFEGKATEPFSLALRGSTKLLDVFRESRSGKALKQLRIDYNRLDTGVGELALEGVLDLAAPPEDNDALADLRKAVSPISLTTKLQVRRDGDNLVAELSADNPLVVKNEMEEIKLSSGRCRIGKGENGEWRMQLEQFKLQRTSEHSDILTEIESAEIKLPPEFGERIGLATQDKSGSGIFDAGPLQGSLELSPGNVAVEGLNLEMPEGIEVSFEANKVGNNLQLRLERREGHVKSSGVAGFLEKHDLPGGGLKQAAQSVGRVAGAIVGGALGFLIGDFHGGVAMGGVQGETLAGKAVEAAADVAANVAARVVKKVDVELRSDGTKVVDIHLPGLRKMKLPPSKTSLLSNEAVDTLPNLESLQLRIGSDESTGLS